MSSGILMFSLLSVFGCRSPSILLVFSMISVISVLTNSFGNMSEVGVVGEVGEVVRIYNKTSK